MDREDYQILKKNIYYANKRDKAPNGMTIDELLEIADKECSPQQNAAITRMLREYEERSYERESSIPF